MSFSRTYAQLRLYIRNLTREKSNLKAPEAFAYWFCQAALLHPDDENAIRNALCGRKYDRNIDVIAWSDISEEIYICQTKFREALAGKTETRNDITAFAHVAEAFSQRSEASMHKCFPDANADVRRLLAKAWRLVQKQGYKLQLLYVSTGKFSSSAVAEAESIVEASRSGAEFRAYDGYDCCRMFISFENLVPAIPFVTISGVQTHMSPAVSAGRIKSAVFSAPVSQIKSIFHKHRERLFARNIRLDKGEKAATNAEIADTLRKYPGHFFYLNNGITILGSEIRAPDRMSDVKEVRIYEPQIINGQQTTRTIGRLREAPRNAEVLVKVICLRPESDTEIREFRRFIYSVVRATNSQTKVNPSELAANNPEQIEIDRAFWRLKWQYIRKTGISSEVAIPGQVVVNGQVTLKALATALVVCEQDPQFIRREGVESLFHSENQDAYDRAFNDGKRDYDYLLCYLLLLLARTRRASGSSKQVRQLASLGQYFVAYVMRRTIDPVYRRHRDKLMDDLSLNLSVRRFAPPLVALCKQVTSAWQSFYRDRRDSEDDPLTFVGQKATKDTWWRYWRSRSCARNRNSAAKLVAALPTARDT